MELSVNREDNEADSKQAEPSAQQATMDLIATAQMKRGRHGNRAEAGKKIRFIAHPTVRWLRLLPPSPWLPREAERQGPAQSTLAIAYGLPLRAPGELPRRGSGDE